MPLCYYARRLTPHGREPLEGTTAQVITDSRRPSFDVAVPACPGVARMSPCQLRASGMSLISRPRFHLLDLLRARSLGTHEVSEHRELIHFMVRTLPSSPRR